MNFGKQIELGVRTYFGAIGFIFSNGLWWAFLFPVAFNLLLFFSGNALVDSLTAPLQDWVTARANLENIDFPLPEFLLGFLKGAIWLIMKLLFFFVFAYFGGYITLMLLSPLLAYLSERTEEIISGRKYPFVLGQFIRDILRGVLIALRNLFFETAWTILLLLLGLFIPVIGWLGVIPVFVISAYFYGFSFIDYTSERRKISIGQSVAFVRTHKWLAIANGTMFCLFLLIPFIGVLLSGFVAIVSVVAATMAVNHIAPVQK
jgi:CysZ protein